MQEVVNPIRRGARPRCAADAAASADAAIEQKKGPAKSRRDQTVQIRPG